MALLIISGKEQNHFMFWLVSDQELEVHTATYRPGIDQSQHVKSVSHIILSLIEQFFNKINTIFNNTQVLKMLWIENFNAMREKLNAKIWGM